MLNLDLQVNKESHLPRHAQVQQILRDLVVKGQLKPGDKIPAELHLAQAMGVSKMTINKALLALTADGLFTREVGRGTFVTCANPAAVARASFPTRITLSFVEGARNILESDYYGSLYRGASEALAEAGESLDISLSPASASDFLAEERRAPAEGRLIIAPRAESIPSIEALWKQGKPLVVVGASWATMGVPSVDSDNIGGAMEAVRHLIELGHQRIALLYAEEETANTQDRIVGYRRALSFARLPMNSRYEIHAEQVWRAGDDARQRLVEVMHDSEPVTAIFAAGYYLALEAKNAVREAGLRVPEDVAVVGFDDPLSAQLVYPPLTTIRQPLHEMGRRAAERLLRLVRGEENRAAIREVLPSQLVVRRSSVPSSASAAKTIAKV